MYPPFFPELVLQPRRRGAPRLRQVLRTLVQGGEGARPEADHVPEQARRARRPQPNRQAGQGRVGHRPRRSHGCSRAREDRQPGMSLYFQGSINGTASTIHG